MAKKTIKFAYKQESLCIGLICEALIAISSNDISINPYLGEWKPLLVLIMTWNTRGLLLIFRLVTEESSRAIINFQGSGPFVNWLSFFAVLFTILLTIHYLFLLPSFIKYRHRVIMITQAKKVLG